MKVNAIIIGAGRSGTTTLYQYLENHQEVCFSDIKEIHYFSVEDLFKRGKDYYHSFWKHCGSEKIKTAADTYLFIDKKAPERIAEYNPDMKIIVILRNPTDRAWSSFKYAVNNGYANKNTSFIQSANNENFHIKNSDITVQNNVCHLWQSKYYEHISFWTNFFPRKNFLFLTTSELKNDTEALLKKISGFLGIDDFETERSDIKANKSAKVRSKSLQQFLLNRNSFLRRVLRTALPEKIKSKILHSSFPEKLSSLNRKVTENELIPDDIRKYIAEALEQDIKRAEDIFGIKF